MVHWRAPGVPGLVVVALGPDVPAGEGASSAGVACDVSGLPEVPGWAGVLELLRVPEVAEVRVAEVRGERGPLGAQV
jgi:hypothetical protein